MKRVVSIYFLILAVVSCHSPRLPELEVDDDRPSLGLLRFNDEFDVLDISVGADSFEYEIFMLVDQYNSAGDRKEIQAIPRIVREGTTAVLGVHYKYEPTPVTLSSSSSFAGKSMVQILAGGVSPGTVELEFMLTLQDNLNNVMISSKPLRLVLQYR